MSLWVVPAFFGALVLYGLSHDVRRWWNRADGLPEALRWWLEQRRELRRMQHGEEVRRSSLNLLEAEWEMPCAPDPKRRIA